MDYTTSVVGIKRGISYQSLRESVYVEHQQGRSNAGEVTIKAVRVALKNLVEADLLESLNADRQLVFRCLLADADDSASNKQGRRRADVGQTYQGRPDASNHVACDDKQGRRRADPKRQKEGTPPGTGIPDKKEKKEREAKNAETNNPKTPTTPTARGARLSLTELPADWETWCRDNRPDLDPAATWETFSDYWIAQPGQKGVKTNWLATWRNWVRRESRRNPLSAKPTTRAVAAQSANNQLLSDIPDNSKAIEGEFHVIENENFG